MHTVSFLLLPGFSLVEVSTTLAVFDGANAMPESASRYAVRLLATRAGEVCSSGGISITAEALPPRFEAPPRMLIIAGGSTADFDSMGRSPRRRAREWLARHQRHVERGAAFGPAARLLLREAAAVAARRRRTAEARAAPSPGEAPVDDPRPDGRWVSTNSGWGMDVALSWIEQDHGRACAETVAARMPWPHSPTYGPGVRRGALHDVPPGEERIAKLHLWVAQNLREHLTVSRLAARSLMSVRSFARYYKRVTGLTPARGVERMRLDAARHLIETSARPLKAIAAQCGYGSQEVMRRAFVRNVGTSPAEYRRRHSAMIRG